MVDLEKLIGIKDSTVLGKKCKTLLFEAYVGTEHSRYRAFFVTENARPAAELLEEHGLIRAQTLHKTHYLLTEKGVNLVAGNLQYFIVEK